MRVLLILILLYSSKGISAPDWIHRILNEYQDVSVHTDASVLVFLNDCDIVISDNGSAESTFRQIIKILNKDALLDQTLFSLRTTNPDNVDSFKAWVIRTDGTEEEIDEGVLLSMGVHETNDYFTDDRFIFGMIPRVGIGTIVAIEYTIEEEEAPSFFQEFVFQNRQPVISSRLKVQIPENWKLNTASLWLDDVFYKRENNIYTWWCGDLKYQPVETLSLPELYMQKQILINCYHREEIHENNFSSWKEVSKWCDRQFENSVRQDEYINEITKIITHGCKTNYEKILAISEFVQTEIRYVAIEIGKNKWIPRDAEATLKNRYGDCKDKTSLMISMLVSQGIKSYPVLVGYQKPIFKDVPSAFQFNHVIVGTPVEPLGKNFASQNAIYQNLLLFDPTDEKIKLGELPISILYSGAVVGLPDGSDFFTLDKTSPLDFMQRFESESIIDNSGNLNCNLSIKYFNALASTIALELKNLSLTEQIEYFELMLREDIVNCHINHLEINKLPDSLIILIQLSSKSYVQKTGDRFIIKAPIINLPELPISNEMERQSPIWMGSPRGIETRSEWKFPDNYFLTAWNDSITSRTECSEVEFYTDITNELVTIKTHLLYDGSVMGKEHFPSVIKFAKKLREINNQSFIIEKKR